MEPDHPPQQPEHELLDEQHVAHDEEPVPATEQAENNSEMRSETPPPVLAEPEVPDPFIVDDGEDDEDDEEELEPAKLTVEVGAGEEEETSAAEDEIALAQSIILDPSILNVDKPVPPPPTQQIQAETQNTDVNEVSGLAYDDGDEDEDDEDEDEEPLELYLPGLILPTMFHPIPSTDPLTSLLTKYIPPEQRPARDVSGDWQHADFHTLVMTNSWRALARMARDRIVSCNPGDVGLILELWSLRLSSLARLRLFNQTSAELNNLYSVLTSNSISSELPTPLPNSKQHGLSPREYLWQNLVPFELEVLHAKTRYWAGDHMGYVDELAELIARCKRKAREATRGGVRNVKGTPQKAGGMATEKAKVREERRKEREKEKEKDREREKEMWKERGARVCLILASQLIEMKEYTAAARLLRPLAYQPSLTPSSEQGSKVASPHILSAIGRIYLQAGDLTKASSYFVQVTSYYNQAVEPKDESLEGLVRMNSALLACAEGRWEEAEQLLVEIVRRDGETYAATNNLAVALLSQGRLKEGIYVLESALSQSPTLLCATEPFLFNLSTLYELRSSTAADKKRELLAEVAKWAGDGLRTACLKMPT